MAPRLTAARRKKGLSFWGPAVKAQHSAGGVGIAGATGMPNFTIPPLNLGIDMSGATDIAELQNRNAGAIADATRDQGYADLDYKTALGRMATQQADSLLNQNQDYNKAGLFYSGALTKRRGEVERTFGENRSDLTQGYQRSTDARTTAIQRIREQEPLAIARLNNEAAMRRAELAAQNQAPAYAAQAQGSSSGFQGTYPTLTAARRKKGLSWWGPA